MSSMWRYEVKTAYCNNFFNVEASFLYLMRVCGNKHVKNFLKMLYKYLQHISMQL